MQLFEAGFRRGLIEEPAREETRARSVFICPMLNAVPEDGVLTYVTIENAGDYIRANEMNVVMFREDQQEHLKLIIDGRKFFDTDVRVLYGVAGAIYGDWFESATVGLERIAYQGFLSEYQMTTAALELERSRNETKHDAERRHLREDGTAPRYGDFGVGEDAEDDYDE